MKKNKLVSRSDRFFDGIMAGLPTLYLILLYTIPTIAGLYFSLTDFGGYNLSYKFIGLTNYKKMFADKVFWISVWNYFKFYLLSSAACYPIAFIFAILLTKNPRLKERAIYRVLFFLPSTIPGMVIGLIWIGMYAQTGAINTILGLIGIDPIRWLGDSKLVMYSLVIVVVWRQMGFYMAYLMAAISNIPDDIFESARIDGASEFTQTIKITMPLSWDCITTCLLFFVKGAMSLGFGLVYIMTKGGPDNASQIMSSYMYYSITNNLDYGMASAISVAILVVTTALSVFILKVMKRETYEY